MSKAPFKDVYLHALVRDEKGQKMSKSRGNVIDPLIMIDKYGADAFRFTLAIFAAQGRDIKMNVDRIEGYRNFINKIWNASRFIFMHLGDNETPFIDETALLPEDKWILMKFQAAASKTAAAIHEYSFNDGANELYQFFWLTFCDWYLEIIKDRLFNGSIDSKNQALAVAVFVLEKSMIALHPFIPFVTEHIYQTLTGKKTIMYETYPDNLTFNFTESEQNMDKVLELINSIRNIRGEYNINPGVAVEVFINTTSKDLENIFKQSQTMVIKLAKISTINYGKTAPVGAASGIGNGFEIKISLEGAMDIKGEITRLQKEKKAAEKDVQLYGGKLANSGYLAKAPAEVIEKDKITYTKAKEKLDKIEETLKVLQEKQG